MSKKAIKYEVVKSADRKDDVGKLCDDVDTTIVLDLKPETEDTPLPAYMAGKPPVVHGNGISETGNTLALFVKLFGPTKEGIMAVGLEARVVKREDKETMVPNVFWGTPIRWTVNLHGKGEFEADFFGDAVFTMYSITIKTLFSIIPGLFDVYGKQHGPATRVATPSYMNDGDSSFAISCVIRSHHLWSRRYILGISTSPDTMAFGAYYGSTLLSDFLGSTIKDEQPTEATTTTTTTTKTTIGEKSLIIYTDEFNTLCSMIKQ